MSTKCYTLLLTDTDNTVIQEWIIEHEADPETNEEAEYSYPLSKDAATMLGQEINDAMVEDNGDAEDEEHDAN